MATLYAATYPERTRALVLFHPRTKGKGTDNREVQEELSDLRERWGTQAFADELLKWGSPTLYEDEEYRRFHANWLRVGASPAVAYALNRAYAETDLTEVLPAPAAARPQRDALAATSSDPALVVDRKGASRNDLDSHHQSLAVQSDLTPHDAGASASPRRQSQECPPGALATGCDYQSGWTAVARFRARIAGQPGGTWQRNV